MPDNAMALNNLGAAYYMLGEFESSAAALQRSLALAPTALAYSNAGSSLFFLGRFEEAAEMYQKAVEYAPEDFQSWGNLGDAYRHSESLYELAEPFYSNAIKLGMERLSVNPSDAITLALMSHYYASIGNREQALQYIARANALAPDIVYVHYDTAVAYATLGELELAMESLKSAVRLGYSRDLVAVDANLGNLRELPAFQLLISQDH
jgi:tetratricopeptide (TPR) repeat protein